MLHTAALFTGLASLALISLLYAIELHAPKHSALRDDSVLMIVVSLLIGAFTMAVAECLVGLRPLMAGGLSLETAVAAGSELVALAGVLLTMVVFRALVVAIRRRRVVPDNVTPLTPRPAAPDAPPPTMKKAA